MLDMWYYLESLLFSFFDSKYLSHIHGKNPEYLRSTPAFGNTVSLPYRVGTNVTKNKTENKQYAD